MPVKTPLSSAIEGLLTGFLNNAATQASNSNPCPALCEPGEPITPESIIVQIEKSLDRGDQHTACRQALTLGALLARQANVGEKDALVFAGLAWGQTSQLTNPSRHG